jgi:DNA-binding HxlR family transcriptional regulator
MCALGSGPHRYNELARRIEGISQKVLTQNLRGLERDGLVERRARGTAPEETDYVLSHLGTVLNGPLRRICKWGEEHSDELDAARSRNQV